MRPLLNIWTAEANALDKLDGDASAIRILKSISARIMLIRFPYLKRKLWAGELWGDGYFVRTNGEGVTSEMVDNHIKQHGAKEAMMAAQLSFFPKKKLARGAVESPRSCRGKVQMPGDLIALSGVAKYGALSQDRSDSALWPAADSCELAPFYVDAW